MTEIESIIEAIKGTLVSGEIKAVTAFPAAAMKRFETPVAAVGLEGGKSVAAGFAEYMGEMYDEDLDETFETYGKRLELEVGIRLYSPKETGAAGCLELTGKVISALQELPCGIKVKGFSCGEVKYDQKTEMFMLPCVLKCVSFLYADRRDDTEILNFTLRGVLK